MRCRIELQGVVQGVGFRPFVYRTALRYGIGGRVWNSSEGVFIEAEAGSDSLDAFLRALRTELPPLARIDQLAVSNQAPLGTLGFQIDGSQSLGDGLTASTLVPPDIATCPECLAEFTNPANRRFQYPFTNCTNCGPRFSIIQDVPYDRSSTTMSGFPLCPACQAEYADPADRRFNAEPNACPECGPRLELVGEAPCDIPPRARELLLSGKILAVKGLGGFHLVCDATNEDAVARLRERKRLNGKAFAVMVRSLEVAEQFCLIADAERGLLEGPRRPIVLLSTIPDSGIAASVAPGQNRLGLMLPYTPLHHLLFDDSLPALVMTSGNLAEEPIVSRNEDAWPRLHTLADHFLLHNRPIQTRVDDSVVQVFEDREYPVRRSRGYAPEPITLRYPIASVLACGGELKNTFCLTKGTHAILSQHIGDLENLETMEFFRETLAHVQRFFRVHPAAVAHDLHPNYLGTRFALHDSGLPPIAVQHHHAHIASCMADNGLDGTVIGVALDGTGYGTDGDIWGGEFLVCNFLDFQRAGHLANIPLPGADAAVRQPWRSALSYLVATFGTIDRKPSLPLFRDVPTEQLRVVETMLERHLNTVQTSSCGRLFDAVASLIGLRHQTTYEGQAAIELEMVASNARGIYDFAITDLIPFQVDLRPTIACIVREMRLGTAPADVSARFHSTVAHIVADGCTRIRDHHGLNRVCLSGGTFQNLRLLGQTIALLRQAGFEAFVHHRVPANDGGLSLGQAVIASHRLCNQF